MEIVKNSAKDCYPAVQKTTLVIMERLQQVLQMEVSFPPISTEGCAKNRVKGLHGGGRKDKVKTVANDNIFYQTLLRQSN